MNNINLKKNQTMLKPRIYYMYNIDMVGTVSQIHTRIRLIRGEILLNLPCDYIACRTVFIVNDCKSYHAHCPLVSKDGHFKEHEGIDDGLKAERTFY